MKFDIATLKNCLDEKPEVVAAYLFGSAIKKGESVVNDLDILFSIDNHQSTIVDPIGYHGIN